MRCIKQSGILSSNPNFNWHVFKVDFLERKWYNLPMKFKHLIYPSFGALLLIGATKNTTLSAVFSEEMTLEEKELMVSARIYSREESQQFLHLDLERKGYIPVEITIQNQGDHAYAISAASTAMSSAKPSEIAWKVTKGAIPRGIGLKIFSFLFWPFMIPSTIDSIYTFKTHKSIVKVLTAKGFKEKDEIVLPYSLVKRVLYIPEASFYATFSVSLEDLTANELVVIPVSADL